MIPGILKSKWGIVFAAIPLFLVLMLFIYWQSWEYIGYLMVVLFGISLTLLFFQGRKWVYYLTMASIPLSINLELFAGNARLLFPSELLLVVLALVLLIQIFSGKALSVEVLRHPLTWLLLIDILWLTVTALTSTMQEVSFKRLIIRVIYFLVFYILMINWFKDYRNIFKPFILYSLGLIPVIAYTLIMHSAYGFVPQVTPTICRPFYNDHTVYAACIAFLIPLFLLMIVHQRKLKVKSILLIYLSIGAFLLIIGEMLAFSRAAWISVIAIAIFFIMLQLRVSRIAVIIMLSGIALISYQYRFDLYNIVKKNESVSNDGTIESHITSITNIKSDASNLERINRWVCAFRMYDEKPWLGFGPGTYQFQYGNYQTSEYQTRISTHQGDLGNAHSEYLTYLSETGLPGLIIFSFIVLYSVFLGMKLYYRNISPQIRIIVLAILLGLTGFYVHGLFNSFIDQAKMASLVFTGLAVLTAVDIYHKEHLYRTGERKEGLKGSDRTDHYPEIK